MIRRLRDLFSELGLVMLCGLAVMLTLAPFFGLFDLFRQIWPATLGLAAIGLAVGLPAMAAHRDPVRLAALTIAIILIILPGIPATVRAWSAPSTTAGDEDFALTLVTHNLWGVGYQTDLARDVLLASGADIIAFQESYDSDRLMASEFGTAYPHAADCHESARIRSRLPMLDSGCITHAPTTDWQNSTLCELDLPPAAWARFAGPGGSVFHVVSVHMDWPSPMGIQDCERANLAMHLARFPNDRLIVMGDFNAADPSLALDRLARDFRLTRLTYGLPSFPAEGRFKKTIRLIPAPVLGIDHVFSGDDWELLDASRLGNTGSDHRPVRAILRLRSE